MPELPEVEAIRLQLKNFLVGHEIVSINVKNRKIFQGDEKKILDTKIGDTRRFGKVTVIDFANGYSILAHVKLTGQFIYKGPNLMSSKPISKKVIGGVPGPHTLVIFNLDKNGVLYYNDVRRFGWIKIEKTGDVEKEKFIKTLGPDALYKLSLEEFKGILSKTSRNIKVVLMDQTKLSGVGNIYANDALWLSKINPKTPSKLLNDIQIKSLYNSIQSVLKEGIKWGGASELAFVTPDGGEGSYQNHSLVYGRQGEVCKHCKKTKIEKYFLGGRGTYWCPVCQE